MAQLAAAGRMLLSPFTGMASWYNRTAQSHPFTVGVVTTGLKTSAADVFAQKVRRAAACALPASAVCRLLAAVRRQHQRLALLDWQGLQPGRNADWAVPEHTRFCNPLSPACGLTCPSCLQQVVEKREDFDWTRHAAFCAFGFAYLGGFQYWL